MTIKYLEHTPATNFCMLSVPFVTNADSCNYTSRSPDDIRAVYQDTLNQFKPSMHELELNSNWEDLENDYKFSDGHPAPIRYYNYLQKLGINLTEKSKQYATEVTDVLKTIENRQIVPLYFPEQDKNVTNSLALLF